MKKLSAVVPLIITIMFGITSGNIVNDFNKSVSFKNEEVEIASSFVKVEENLKEFYIEKDEYIEANKRVEVFEGLTIEELGEKLERSLNSTLSGKGQFMANYAMEVNVNPYIALGIILEETGCTWNCSYLVNSCNNIGGQKGYNEGHCGSYRSFSSLDEGIKGFYDNLSNNYFSVGLNTPELINRKYAESTVWATKINRYVEKIKNA